MAEYVRSEWTTPLDVDQRKRLILGFQPLTPDEREKLHEQLRGQNIVDPQQTRAAAIGAIPYAKARDRLRQVSREVLAKAEELGLHRHYRNLVDALLFETLSGLAPAAVQAANPQDVADGVKRRFDADVLYTDRLADLLADRQLKIDADMMGRLYQHLRAGGVPVDSAKLPALVFDFLENPGDPPKLKEDSPLTTPLPLPAAIQVLADFRLLAGGVPASVKALVRNKRISDPQALRALAVETAIPATKLRELVRTIRSTISSDGGSPHLRGFPQLPETIVYEFVNDKRKDLEDLCSNDIGCELRAFADTFFREHRDELYKERIREALSARGFALDDQRLEQTYLHMLRQRVPLPARPLPGAFR